MWDASRGSRDHELTWGELLLMGEIQSLTSKWGPLADTKELVGELILTHPAHSITGTYQPSTHSLNPLSDNFSLRSIHGMERRENFWTPMWHTEQGKHERGGLLSCRNLLNRPTTTTTNRQQPQDKNTWQTDRNWIQQRQKYWTSTDKTNN